MKPITNKAYKLLHDGCIALSQVEANGMRIDEKYLHKSIKKTTNKIEQIYLKMKEDKIWKKWKRQFGQKTNMGSRVQLGKILFDVMKYPCPAETDTGRHKVDEAVLETIDLPFVQRFVQIEKLKKTRSTYLKGILRETTDGFLHPFFNLHLAQTFRSSSDHPNFQNIPMKDPAMKKLVRRAFIARPNHQIVEVDYSGAEISSATCYHHDPRMIKYIVKQPGKLHTDMAMKCYMLTEEQVSWDARDTSKNMFVFPEFYGDVYTSSAKSMWEAILRRHIQTNDGVSLIKHLREMGIKKLGKCNLKEKPRPGTFEKHIKKVEYDFWYKRFKVYRKWKEQWWESYLRQGYFVTLTEFKIEGIYKRNEVINYPIQGVAFHWLLWSLIRINKLLKKYKMKSVVTGQIHDSIVGDIHKKELKDYLEMAKQVMTIDVRKHWDWIMVPLKVEADVAPVGGTWYDKEEFKI